MSDPREDLNLLLARIDTENADISSVEESVLKALSKQQKNNSLAPPPINSLSDPIHLDELVGDNFRYQTEMVAELALGTDKYYERLTDLNNTFMSEIENAERIIVTTADQVQSVTSFSQDLDSNYVWLSDSFNDTVFVDLSKSSVLVDTDIGAVYLNPSSQKVIEDLNFNFSKQDLTGIPGCNLLILDNKNPGDSNTSPTPTVEKESVTDLSAILDNNNQTWFEVERNLIPKNQPIRRANRSWVYDLGASAQNIIEATGDFDWKVSVAYPDGIVDNGPEGKGVYVAEFLEDKIDPTSTTTYDTKCSLKVDLTQAQPISFIKLIPFVRANQGQIFLESIVIICDGQPIVIAKNVDLSIQSKPTKTLQKEILRRTGSSSIGSVFTVPTNRNVTSVIVNLVGRPYKADYGFAHRFKEENIKQETTRRYLFASSVSRNTFWNRKPINDASVPLEIKTRELNLLGTTQATLSSLFELGGGVEKLLNKTDNQNNVNVLSKAGEVLSSVKGLTGVGKVLGSAGSFLGKAVPVIGTALVINDLIKNAFGASTKKTLVGEEVGFDVFTGWRSYVAIRDLTITRDTYADNSEVVSLKRSFSTPVKKVGLVVESVVPAEWGPGDWVTYYLSTDGVNWVSVAPLGQITLEQSFTPTTPTTEIFFRAVIKGNSQDIYSTPILKHYTLQGLPAGN